MAGNNEKKKSFNFYLHVSGLGSFVKKIQMKGESKWPTIK